jgi:hypothetical protein
MADAWASEIFGKRQDTVIISNFYHQGSFWVAEIPITRIRNLYYLVNQINTGMIFPAVHTQVRVNFSEPVRLVPQESLELDKMQKTYDMFLTIDAVTTLGKKFNFFKGFRKNYVLAYRAVSLKERYDLHVGKMSETVYQYRIKLSPEEQKAALMTYLKTASNCNYTNVYHTLKNNCITEIYKIFRDQTLPKYKMGFFSCFSSHVVRRVLRGSNLICEKSPFTLTYRERSNSI